jgi:pimeloyl-ACP methyl ester carboxylesterase
MKYLILLSFFFIGSNGATTGCDRTFLRFIGNSLNDYVDVSRTSSLTALQTPLFQPQNKYYNPAKPTVMYINGWRLNYQSDDVKAVLGNYVTAWRSEFNIVYVDWSNYTNNFVYITSLGAMQGTALNTYEIMDRLVNDMLIKFDIFNIHMIGYDLGAHFAHMIAHEIQVWKGFGFGRIKRITGLDPAGLFQFGEFLFAMFNVKILKAGKADWTDIIHTSMNKFGVGPKYGDADYYPNGGETQPGCTAKKSIQDFLANQDINQFDKLCCSHSRAWELYAESVVSPNTVFNSTWCLFSERSPSCNGNLYSSMGFHSQRLTGTSYEFYVATNNQSLYSLT